jgi:putative endonuclease
VKKAQKSAAADKGKEGEKAAALALQKEGMRILYKNFRSPAGEIDLIAEDEEILVFVEVKNWTYGIENLDYSIGEKKKRRIIETAKYFLSIHREYNDRPIRFDVVFLRSKNEVLRFESAFTEI